MDMNKKRTLLVALLALSFSWGFTDAILADGEKKEFTEDFFIEECSFANTGANTFFILEVGHKLVLLGEDGKEEVCVEITVLPDTELVDGVRTRVVEEVEYVDGELVEISRNFFARCRETNSVFYFGEDVDIFEEDGTVSHEGEWRAGVDGAKPGIFMPGTVLHGSRYFQEIADEVAMDRAEHIALGVDIETPAGTFTECLVVEETTPLEPGARDIKVHCPGIGLVFDAGIELIEEDSCPEE
jgi:hypothetical protein